jgi:hypothetical protein
MEVAEKPFDLPGKLPDLSLYKAIREAARQEGRPVPEIVAEALGEWLARHEDQEDLAAIAATEGEETSSWEQVKRELREARAKELRE